MKLTEIKHDDRTVHLDLSQVASVESTGELERRERKAERTYLTMASGVVYVVEGDCAEWCDKVNKAKG